MFNKITIILISCILLLIPSFTRSEIYVSDKLSATVGFEGNQPTGSGGFSNSVNLYTGQHVERYNLVSIPGKNGMGASLSLGYSGNVSNQAKISNRYSQTSPFGLGFDLGQEKIVVNHMNTIDISDDSYLLIVGGQSMKLMPKIGIDRCLECTFWDNNSWPWTCINYVSSEGPDCDSVTYMELTNQYETQSQIPWRIYSTVLYESGVAIQVIGWTIIKEDGSIYKYGDFNDGLTNRNSTEYTLRWGSSIGSGHGTGDILFPIKWNLSSVSDIEEHNYVNYGYLQEFDKVKYGILGFDSDNDYTRFSYLDKVTTSLGYTAEFIFSSREDMGRFENDHVIQNYQTYKVDSIVIKNPSNDITGRVAFDYTYLNSTSDYTRKKLLLNKIKNVSVDELSSKLIASFDYYETLTDPSYASIHNIYSTLGGTKSIEYKLIEADSNFANLDYSTQDDEIEYLRFSTGPNSFIFDSHTSSFIYKTVYGNLDGYWTTEIISGDNLSNIQAVSGEGWNAIYEKTEKEIHVNRWLHGEWKEEIIPTSWTPTAMVTLIPGNDFIVAHDGRKKFYFYKYNGMEWNEYYLTDADDAAGIDFWYVANIEISSDLVMIHLYRQDGENNFPNAIIAAKYDSNSDEIVRNIKYPSNATNSDWFKEHPAKLKNNYIVYRPGQNASSLNVLEWNNNSWQESVSVINSRGQFAITEDGIFTFYHTMVTDPWFQTTHYSYFQATALHTATGWQITTRTLAENILLSVANPPPNYQHKLYTSSDIVVATDLPTNLYFAGIWKRYLNVYGLIDFEVDPGAKVKVPENMVCAESAGNIIVKRHLGSNEWGSTDTLLTSAYIHPIESAKWHSYTCQDDLVVAAKSDGSDVFAYKYNYDLSKWDTLSLASALPVPFDELMVESSGDCFYIAITPNSNLDVSYQYYFKWYKDQCFGKANYPVVNQVISKSFSTDPNAIAVDYSYVGGFLDESATTPRFARTTVSTPHFVSAPNDILGYTEHNFYNDMFIIDPTTSYDSRYASIKSILPTIDQNLFLLDGSEYFTKLRNKDGSGSPTTSELEYTTELISSYGPRFKGKITTITEIDEDISTTTHFTYESEYNQLTSSRTEYLNPNSFIVDSNVYAYEIPEHIGMLDDHAIGQTARKYKFLDDNGTITWLGRSGADFVKNGNWKPEKNYSWSSLDNENSKFITSNLLPSSNSFDSYGNVVMVMNVNGDTSSVKYSPDGQNIVGSIKNGYLHSVLLFDAEYDFVNDIGYDGWVNRSPSYGSLSSEEKVTGSQSFKLIDDLTSNFATQGLWRTINKVDLIRRQFLLSYWVKSNAVVSGYVGVNLTTPISPAFIIPDYPGDNKWHKIEKVITLTETQFDELVEMYISINMENGINNVAYIDGVRFHPLDAHVTTTTYDKLTNSMLSKSGINNISTQYEYDKFNRLVTVKDNLGSIKSTKEYYDSDETPFNPNSPNYVKNTIFIGGGSNVSILYFDGLGRTLQHRTTSNIGNDYAIVSGIAEYDEFNRVERIYKPYIDLDGASSVEDYVDQATVISEIKAYYTDLGPGVNCKNYPYVEKDYSNDFKGELIKLASPGEDFNIITTHNKKFDSFTRTSSDEIVSTIVDEDNSKSVSIQDRWNRFSRNGRLLYEMGVESDTIMTITNKDLNGRVTSVYIDTFCLNSTGTDEIYLRSNTYNDIGQKVEINKVDYGTVKMRYDKSGKLRFMQNDKRLAEKKFVYFKYDKLGRKISEGIMDDPLSNYFTNTNAEDQNFPEYGQGLSFTLEFRWIYDYYEITGDSTIVNPGSLVRVECGDSSYLGPYYYKEFYAFPEENYDITVTQLLMGSLASLKAVRHDYNVDGTLNYTTIYPHWPNTSDRREIGNEYGQDGSLASIHNQGSFTPPFSIPITHVLYEKNPDGTLNETNYGVTNFGADKVQTLDYQYDSRGMLVGINDPSSVSTSQSGGSPNSYFGLNLQYIDGVQNQYYNGRPSGLLTSTSDGSIGGLEHNYGFKYHDLGWLEVADNLNNDSFDRDYNYNKLGFREDVTEGSNQIVYTYYEDEAGSSRLKNITGMTSDMEYDVLGNMIKDPSHNVNLMKYDYRNLMRISRIQAAASSTSEDYLYMYYDESGQRTKKVYTYKYWSTCGGVIDPRPLSSMSSGGGILESSSFSSGGTQALGPGPDPDPGGTYPCLKTATTSVFYLYDDGVLVATFNEDDNVLETFVNGPEGHIASYKENDDSKLFYYIKDQIGSPRVVMLADVGGLGIPTIAQTINYLPFGGVASSSGFVNTPYKFTGKEQDLYSTFDYTYFGSRYYDKRTGFFTSIDKAGQFTSGYMYGGNNPILGIDPDGNLFFVPFLVGAVYGGIFSAVTYTAMTTITGNAWTWNGFGKSMFTGAIGGGLGGVASQLGGQLANNIGYKMLSDATVNASTSIITGQEVNLSSMLGSVAGSLAAYKMVGNFRADTRSRWSNIGSELGFSALSGGISVGVGGMATNGLRGENIFRNLGGNYAAGITGGISSAIANIAVMGGAIRPPQEIEQQIEAASKDYGIKYRPLYRSGGLWGLGAKYLLLPAGFAGFGRNIIVNAGDPEYNEVGNRYLWTHETAHFWQQSLNGWGATIGALAWEQIILGSNAYNIQGTYENGADVISADVIKKYFY